MVPTKGGLRVTRPGPDSWLCHRLGDFTPLNTVGALCVHTEMVTKNNDFSGLGTLHTCVFQEQKCLRVSPGPTDLLVLTIPAGHHLMLVTRPSPFWQSLV